jgi:hypothetical protein
MPLDAEHAIDGANEEEAICGGLITKVIRKKKGSAGQNLSGRARAIFTRAVNLRGFLPGVPTGVGKNYDTLAVKTVQMRIPGRLDLATFSFRDEKKNAASIYK